MNCLKREEELELRLITSYQAGGCACRVQDLRSLGGRLRWTLIAAITAKRDGAYLPVLHITRGVKW